MDGCPYHLQVPFVDEPRITEKYAEERLEQAVRETPFSLPRAEAQKVIEARRVSLEEAPKKRLKVLEPKTLSEKSKL